MIDELDNGDQRVVYIDTVAGEDFVFQVDVTAGVVGSPVQVLGPTDSTPECAAPIDVLEIDVEEDTLALFTSCGSGNHLLVDSGSGLTTAVGPNEPLSGGDTTLTIEDFSLGREPEGGIELLYWGNTNTGGESIIASCPGATGTCSRLVGSNDFGGDEVSEPGHMGEFPTFLTDTPASGTPANDLYWLDRATRLTVVPRRMLGAGDSNPTASTAVFDITGIRGASPGEGGVMVEAALGASRQLFLIEPKQPAGFTLLRPSPGRTGSIAARASSPRSPRSATSPPSGSPLARTSRAIATC